jgi:SAM-dependent methyltransferase
MSEQGMPPQALLMSLITGRFMTQSLGVVAELRIADQLEDGPLDADELARRTGAHGPSVYRLLRALSMVGLFTEHEGQRFSLTPAGELLRTDAPGSLAGMARFMSQGWHAQAWAAMPESVRTGEPGFIKAFGTPMFKWFVDHPTEAQIFHEAMTGFSGALAQAVLAAYDFSRFATIADIGGGHGTLLAAILAKTPGAKGTVFDLPQVVQGAQPILEKAGVAARCQTIGGDFFASVPAGFDAYVLKHIIHDWSDAAAAKILRQCAAGLNPGGRVLLVEMVVPPPGVPSFAKMLDLEMLVMTEGGRERTEPELRALFAESGLELERIVSTPAPVSVIEARAR